MQTAFLGSETYDSTSFNLERARTIHRSPAKAAGPIREFLKQCRGIMYHFVRGGAFAWEFQSDGVLIVLRGVSR